MLDPGHGGSDVGAVNPGLRLDTLSDDVYEKELNLWAAEELAVSLKDRGFAVLHTRTVDRYVEINERIRAANMAKADLFVSLHCNGAENRDARGFEVIYDDASPAGKDFAETVCRRFAEAFPTIRMRGAKSDAQTPRRHLAVLEKTGMPAILVELGFVTNCEELFWLIDNMRPISEVLAEGIKEYAKC